MKNLRLRKKVSLANVSTWTLEEFKSFCESYPHLVDKLWTAFSHAA